MSLKLKRDGTIPAETERVAHAVFVKGNIYMKLRDELGTLYADEDFAQLYARHGAVAESAAALALVSVMQYMENLDDRQTAEAVRSRIDWKYVLGLPLEDSGFDFTVLSQFRDRLLAGGAEEQILDLMVQHLVARGLLRARGRQRSDSTHVLAKIRTLNRLELVGETLRAALNVLAVVVPEWVQAWTPLEWYERYGPRVEQYRLPASESERRTLGEQTGSDGMHLWARVTSEAAPPWLRQIPALEVLRQVWLQHYWVDDGQVRWREAGNMPAGAALIQSPYDVEARYSQKRNTIWNGYKVHLTESCDDDQPHLITHIETTASPVPDQNLPPTIHAALASKGLLPSEHLLDQGYMDAEQLVNAQQDYQIRLIGPVPPDTSWQARQQQGFDLSAFQIDWQAHTVTCPQGRPSRVWSSSHDTYGNDVIHVHFDPLDCAGCACRTLCTRAKTGPRALKLRPQAQHEALHQARQFQTTPEFRNQYAARAGAEATLSQGTRAFGLRRARYIGQAKTHLQHIFTAAAMNLTRLTDWWHQQEAPRAKRPPNRFAALAPLAQALC